MLLHVIFPSKYFSTVGAGKAGRAVETSNVAQQIVPPRKAGTTMGSGAGEGANACVGFEVNLKMGSFGESFATVRDVAEVALVTTSFDAGNTMGTGAWIGYPSSWPAPGLCRCNWYLFVREQEEKIGARDWDNSSWHCSVRCSWWRRTRCKSWRSHSYF